MFTIIKETITYILTVLGFIIGAVSLYITLRDKKVQEETSDEQKKLLERLNHSFKEVWLFYSGGKWNRNIVIICGFKR